MSTQNGPLEVIKSMKGAFTQLSEENGYPVTWKNECVFARQLITKNDFAFKVARNNPKSLENAILNVASIGISLNPALAHAYLVPRDGSIYLDISYKGLVKIATESGAIMWAKSELVYKNDKFTYNGPAKPPTHEADVFGDRGEIIGGYCIAKLPTNDTLIEVMKLDEILKVRDTSKAAQKGKGPWVDWFEEMAKKTITKRAYKSWPQTDNRERLDKAIDALHDSEGMAYTIEQQADFMELIRTGDAMGLLIFQKSVSETTWNALFNSFEKGKKTENKELIRNLERQAFEQLGAYAVEITEALDADDTQGAFEIYNDIPHELIDPLLGDTALRLQQIENAA
jgi:phage RecT family recombinase